MNNQVSMVDVKYNGTLEELGENFIRVGNDFISLYKEISDKSIIDFSAMSVNESPCGTVACHGGWGLVMYAEEGTIVGDSTTDFIEGAQLIEQRLGFDLFEGENLERFARQNPVIWGNTFGGCMFSNNGHMAFGDSDDIGITLEAIGKYYIEVGKRILERKDWTIVK